MKHHFLLSICIAFTFLSGAQAQKMQKIDQLLFLNKYEQAILLLEQKINKDSLQPQAYYRLGKAYQATQRNMKAIPAFEKALKLDSLSINNRLALGNCYFSSGMYPDAQRLLEDTYRLDSINPSNTSLLAKTYQVQKNYRKASHLYQKLILQDSINPYYYKQLGMVSEKMLHHQTALDCFNKAYHLNTRDFSSLVKLISSYYEFTAYQMALQYINKGLKDYPNHPILLKKKATILINKKWFENAQVVLEKIVQLGKAEPRTYIQLGLCYLNAKDYERALTAFQKVGPMFEKDPKVNLYLGITLQKMGRHKESLEKLKSAETHFNADDLISTKLYQARAYGFLRQFENSVNAYLLCEELGYHNTSILYEIATTYEEFGNNKKEAIDYYSRYLNQDTGKNKKRKEYARSRILHLKESLHFER